VADLSVNLNHQADKYYSCLHLSKRSDEADELNEQLMFAHQGTRSFLTQIITTKELLPIYLVIVFYLVLLMFSALFSGLNLGLMSLDLRELSLLKKSGTKREKSYAKKIYPLRKRGNQLLCTILLGNVLVNSTSTLILGNYIDGMFAAIGSTLLIVIFGEIIPQAVCSRYGLAVGAHTRYITYSVMGLTFPISYPLAKILDFFLGKEIAASYSRENLRELMRKAADEQQIQKTQFNLIAGALDFKNKYVKDTMVHVKDVFSLDINSILDFDTFKSILYHGYSRIPVYEHTK
jgi:metal transporter CNNM